MSNSVIQKLVIAFTFTRLKVLDLLAKGRAVLTNMGLNVEKYPTPPVTMAVLKQDLDNLQASYDAALDGSRKAILQRDKDRIVVEQDLSLLGAYAVRAANNDPAILALS